ncbi:DUF4145 domain-containing protein [Paenibacillus albicereus]|uniref:DUF4145 domain-containing protein n=1 Tax=Paenibacillus albicereus TaxID=2726185 RepID=A0A6H2GZD9_9BACL|nr:DUF4145 domain-containing protein [Paenibacillus albicereus]QJC52801.1 DUF4145 domain-containing protein [Paenibacillus albicereus]
MKSILFEVKKDQITVLPNPNLESKFPYLWYHKINILPAFSVGHFIGYLGSLAGVSTNEDRIEGNNIVMASDAGEDGVQTIHIVLNYYGIRDYALLFPWITDLKLRTRVGAFYEEAEKSFEQGVWLSFALMCGAVFEGMLYAKLKATDELNLNGMIIQAVSEGLIDDHQANIMHMVRRMRNLVHGSQYNKRYISRKDAMDISSLLIDLVKHFSY